MKKLLAALAVVAGLGFVVSCSDEVSEYTISAPQAGEDHNVTGKVTGKYTRTYYLVETHEPGEYKWDNKKNEQVWTVDSSYEKVTANSGSYWYRKVTFETEFEGVGADVTWSKISKGFSAEENASSYNSQKYNKTEYVVNLGNLKYSNFKYTVKGLDAGKNYYDEWNPISSKPGLLTAADVSIPKSYTFNKVGDTYIYYGTKQYVNGTSKAVDVDVDVTSCFNTVNLEGDFTVTNLVKSEGIYTVEPYYETSDGQSGNLDEIETNLKMTETITFTFKK